MNGNSTNQYSMMKILHIAEGVERYLSMLLPLLEQHNMKQYFLCSQNYDKDKYTTHDRT